MINRSCGFFVVNPLAQEQGLAYMLDVAQSKKKKDANVIPSAQYNVGRAYFMVSIENNTCIRFSVRVHLLLDV